MRKQKRLSDIWVPEEKLRDIMELYPGKTRDEIGAILYKEVKKKLFQGITAAGFLLLLAMFARQKQPEEGILRPEPGNGAVSVQVQVELDDGPAEIVVPIGALEYEESRIEELHREAENYLDKVLTGENKSLEKVTGDLFFPKTLPYTGEEIVWSTDAPWLVTAEGDVLNHNLETPEKVEVTAKIFYGAEARVFSKIVSVYPAVYTERELLLQKVQEELVSKEEETRTGERFFLPENVLGYPVKQAESTDVGMTGFLVILALVIPMLSYYSYFGTLDTKRKKRKELAENSYPEFVTKLSLLLAAGNSMRQAFMRLAAEYENNQDPSHVLAAELRVTKQELDNGRSEMVVYEDFGRRVGVLAYRRMASLLTQSVSKGVYGMKDLLLQEAREVMAQEKARIRQKGEQAGTKLLFPMTGMLFLVFAILLVPAFQSF